MSASIIDRILTNIPELDLLDASAELERTEAFFGQGCHRTMFRFSSNSDRFVTTLRGTSCRNGPFAARTSADACRSC